MILTNYTHDFYEKIFAEAKIPVPTALNINAWRSRLHSFTDNVIVDYLEFGWPVNYQRSQLPTTRIHNHPAATNNQVHVDKFLAKEVSLGATAGPFLQNPLDLPLATSPLSAVPKRDSTDKRIVMDLSFPTALSVNDGIPNDNFLGESYTLTYPTIHSLLDLVRQHGNGCLLYKLDLRRAYRQFPVDPRDYHLLGLWWKDMYFIDMRLPFGLRSAPQACQRITDAVRYMHLRDGYHLVNYLDDFCGVSSPERASAGFSALRSLLQELGLDEAYEKAVSPTTRLTFIGLEVDTIAMTVSVPEDKLCDLESILNKWQNKRRCTKRQLQNLIGKLSFVATCIPPGRIFMSRLLQMLRLLYRQHHHAHLTQNFRKNIQWWQTFLRSYNGISLILEDNTTPVPDAIVASDACLTGCGGDLFYKILNFHSRTSNAI
ncbi:hypothetical protein QZH41_001624 [Actinostola sp. cb2023]|nr:hypothetical protein QZH41_001624 [Actinostola sp. cb2023]